MNSALRSWALLLALLGLGLNTPFAPARADSVENMHLLHRAMMHQRTHPTVATDLPEPFKVLLGQGDWGGWMGLLDSWGMDFNAAFRDFDPSDGEVLIIGGTLWDEHRPVLVLRASDYRLLALRYPLESAPEPTPTPSDDSVPFPLALEDNPPQNDPGTNAETDIPPANQEESPTWHWATVEIHYNAEGRADGLTPGWWPPKPVIEEPPPAIPDPLPGAADPTPPPPPHEKAP